MKKHLVNLIFLVIFLGAIAFKLYLVYWGYEAYGYIAPPGGDAPNHLAIIKALESGETLFGSYPKLFHWLIIKTAQILNKDTFEIVALYTPVLVILPVVAVYFMLRQLFSSRGAMLGALSLLFLSYYPILGFIDGNYPDMLAYGFLTPFYIGFFIRFVVARRRIDCFLVVAFLFLIALTHHFTLSIVLGITIIYLLIIGIYNWQKWKYDWPRKSRLLSKGLFLVFGFLIINFLYKGVILNFLTALFTQNPFLKDDYLNDPEKIWEFGNVLGPSFWFFGAIGAVWFLLQSKSNRKIKLLIGIWLALLFLASSTSIASLPVRFLRELAIPLTIGLAFFWEELFNLIEKRITRLVGYGFIGAFLLYNSMLFTGPGSLPSAFNQHMWFWPIDQEKLDFIVSLKTDKKIVSNSYANPYFSIKSQILLLDFNMNDAWKTILHEYNNRHLTDNKEIEQDYNNIMASARKQLRGRIVLASVKPNVNTNPKVYPVYEKFDEANQILRQIASEAKILKKFADGSIVFETN